MHLTFHIANLSNSGGTQRILSLLCNCLIEYYSISIIINRSGSSFFPLDKRIKVEILNGNLLQKNIHIYKILKKNKSIYYINLDCNSVLFNGFLLPTQTRLIIWEHFSIVNNYQKWIFSISRKYAVKRATYFVLLSKFEVSQWNQLYNLRMSKAILIYNPVITENRLIRNTSTFDFKTLLAIGNNIEVKGFDILLEAWKKINTDWKLKIVGLPRLQINNLKRFLVKNNLRNVCLYPKTTKIQEFYQTSSAFVLSSRKDATPLVLIESQSYGLPAVVFDHLNSIEELLDNSALIADYSSPIESLKKNLELLINDKNLYHKISENALINAKRFDIDTFLQKWKDILK